jgi:hypothetical protein
MHPGHLLCGRRRRGRQKLLTCGRAVGRRAMPTTQNTTICARRLAQTAINQAYRFGREYVERGLPVPIAGSVERG